MATRSLLTVPLLITVAAAAAAWFVLGPAAALAFVALALLEIAMAADSSVPMAGIAGRLHSPARRLFLSLGIVAGVLAMRLLLPPAAVAVGDATDPASSVQEAVFAPGSFSAHLAEVRPALAAFGAAFIWLVFAEYLFNTDRASRRSWLGRLEARLAAVARPRVWSLVTAATGVAVTAVARRRRPRVVAGGRCCRSCSAARRASPRTSGRSASPPGRSTGSGRTPRRSGSGGAPGGSTPTRRRSCSSGGSSCSCCSRSWTGCTACRAPGTLGADGLGALEQAAVAVAAIGVGAVFLARLTSRLDEAAGLKRLRYLKAGAAYVLGVLAVLLWASLLVPIPGVVVGWFGSVVIGSALASSLPWRAWWRRLSRRPHPV